MPTVTFIDHEGGERPVWSEAGISLMEAARNADIPGIVAECGGMCACATCHVFIDPAFMEIVGAANENEAAMLEFVDDALPNSRLSCQVIVSDMLEGLRVTTPETQG